MRHKKKKNITGRKSGSDATLKRNLASSLIINEKINTTDKRAKVVIPFLQKLITISKKKNLHNKRKINSLLNHKEAEKKLINEIGIKYKDREGGCVRTYRVGNRKGDNAKMIRVELI